jgi:hypothetical protein
MRILISESKMNDLFQKFINKSFKQIKISCEEIGDDGEICGDYENIIDIKIVDVKKTENGFLIYVDIYSDALRYSEYDGIMYELNYKFRWFFGEGVIKVIHNSTIMTKEHNY